MSVLWVSAWQEVCRWGGLGSAAEGVLGRLQLLHPNLDFFFLFYSHNLQSAFPEHAFWELNAMAGLDLILNRSS